MSVTHAALMEGARPGRPIATRKRRKRGPDPIKVANFLEACARNSTLSDVARELGVSPQRAAYLAKQHGVRVRSVLDIAEY